MATTDKERGANSIFKMNGSSNHSTEDRVERDYYATDPDAVRVFLEEERFSSKVWECAVGGGHIADVLKDYGYDVYSTDITDRGYPNTEIMDFLECEVEENDVDIITNPPYSKAKEFVKKALDISKDGVKVAMLLRLQFLEGKRRAELFNEYPPCKVYVNVSRVTCAKNGDFEKHLRETGSSPVAYAWFVWEKGYTGDPIIKWIN